MKTTTTVPLLCGALALLLTAGLGCDVEETRDEPRAEDELTLDEAADEAAQLLGLDDYVAVEVESLDDVEPPSISDTLTTEDRVTELSCVIHDGCFACAHFDDADCFTTASVCWGGGAAVHIWC